MRVISGVKKGTRLARVKHDTIRPTTDRLKELIFDVIGDSIKEAVVLDIFAGSGSLGIEALSRGAVKAIFIDNNTHALRVLTQNLRRTGFSSSSDIFATSAEKALRKLGKMKARFDYIFADPPYYKSLTRDTLVAVDENELLVNNGWLIIEHDASDECMDSVGRLYVTKQKRRGDSILSFYLNGFR